MHQITHHHTLQVQEAEEASLEAEEEAVAALAAAGMADKSGARALRRILRTQVEDAVAEEILSGHLRSGDTAVIVRQGEGVSVRCAAGVT